ncbi:MAG: aminoacyl-tRNA hydrolase [Planctomycetota bacterium]|nr:aminoacyl-tRNA hydrolase [Planctomycetota bacterium]
MKIVVGLGNPGSQYLKTRHNVGFEVLHELARRHGGSLTAKFDAEIADLFVQNQKLLLVAPQTFMNCSGRSVRKVVDFYQADLADLVVVCDDMNLDLGRLRWRASGSAGGQKGLADTIKHLGTPDFPRLRLGIGRPPGRMQPTDFVLGKFRGEDVGLVDDMIMRAADSVEIWASDGLEAAMNRFNRDVSPSG